MWHVHSGVFERERWVSGWLGGRGGRRWRECENSTTLPHCAFLPDAVPLTSPPPLSLHTLGVACLACRHGCLLGWQRGGCGSGVFRGGGGQLTDICSAETKGRRAPGIGGWGVGGIGKRLAGYSRGGGAGSRRWMALTESRLLKQHDISWNESPHTHEHTLLATHTRLCFHAHKLALGRPSPALSLPSTWLLLTSHFKFPQSRHVRHGIARSKGFSSAVD